MQNPTTKKAGYEYLLAYKVTVPIYDLTVEFCELVYNNYNSYKDYKIYMGSLEKAVREIREIGQIWKIIKENPTLPNSPNFPHLPHNPKLAVNLMITLINQANYLIDKLLVSLKDTHMKKGGLSEELFRKRKEYRGY